MTDLISDHNLSDCLALLFCLLPSPLSLSLCSWSGWRQQKQVSDVVDYAGLHSPGWRGAGSQSFRGQEVHSPSFSQTQVTTVSPFNSSDCSFDCELNPYQGITEKTCFIWSVYSHYQIMWKRVLVVRDITRITPWFCICTLVCKALSFCWPATTAVFWPNVTSLVGHSGQLFFFREKDVKAHYTLPVQ